MWRQLLATKVSECTPILSRKKSKVSSLDLPCIVNMVSTVSILPPNGGYRLPLEALSMRLGPCAQYSPMQFAAIISRISNSTADTTTLIFGTGKLVVVSGRTEMHTCYMSQFMRLLVEETLCYENSEPPHATSLRGSTIFRDHVTHNIVGSGELGCSINLQAFRDANAGSVKYLSDSFPAAKASVWITEDQQCHCGHFAAREDIEDIINSGLGLSRPRARKTKTKCACTVKCLLFKTGRIVLIGAHSVEDIYSVFLRMKEKIHDFAKLGSMLQKKTILPPQVGEEGKKPPRTGPSQSETIALALEGARAGRKIISSSSSTNGGAEGSHLLRLADAGRLAEVQMTLAMEPHLLNAAKDEYGRTAAQRLASVADRTAEQEEVLKYLQSLQQ